MTVEEKIQQAERWLCKLKQTYPNQTEVEDNLSAFLSSTNSIANHLLEDYNKKYNLGVPLTDDLYVNKFEDKAKSQKKSDAIAFITWYKQKIRTIELDPVGSKLTNKRHLDIHRLIQRPNHIVININESIKVSDSVSVKEFPADMTAEEALKITREEAEKEKKESREKTENKPKPSESNSQVDLYFQDLPNINVKDACEKFLDLMKDLVTEAHTQFP